MSTSHVVRLDDYRSRRNERLHRALTLSGWRAAEQSRTSLLARALEIAGADRAVSFWVDEYHSDGIHIDRVVDLASDPPRRTVSPDLLERAYDHGFPGLIDTPDATRAGALLFPEVPSSSVLLSVGSDGTQSWFLLVDGLTPRARLDARQRERLMFLAGELSTLLMREQNIRWQGVEGSFERTREEAFAGWGVLGDLAEGTLSEAHRPIVNVRFLLARLVKTYIDEGLVMDATILASQADEIRGAVAELNGGLEEIPFIESSVDALDAGDLPGLASSVLGLADHYWVARNLHAARDLYLSAHELAVALSDADIAALSAWGLGRSSRLAADWDGAFRWYGIAADIASAMNDPHRHGRILDGLANAYRDRGNLPKARTTLARALDIASAEGDGELRATVFHNLMTVEKQAGECGRAIVYGWESIQAQSCPVARRYAMVDLGSVFMEGGQLDDAEETLTLVLAEDLDLDARVMALSTLTQVAALRGNRGEFTRLCGELEEAGWNQASSLVRAQVMLDRGVSWARLGEAKKARDGLGLALAYAEAQNVAKIVLDADEALKALDEGALGAGPSEESVRKVEKDQRVAQVRQSLHQYASVTA